jgi:hypothetical protein
MEDSDVDREDMNSNSDQDDSNVENADNETYEPGELSALRDSIKRKGNNR